jgi:hypothetical protein
MWLIQNYPIFIGSKISNFETQFEEVYKKCGNYLRSINMKYFDNRQQICRIEKNNSNFKSDVSFDYNDLKYLVY